MTSYLEARNLIIPLLPELKGWNVYTDGIATGASPPWVVASLKEKGREHTESLHASNHLAVLDIRVVGLSETGIGIVCDKLSNALDGAKAAPCGILVPDIDSGSYPSDLMIPDTSTPFLMRVLTWRTGWPA